MVIDIQTGVPTVSQKAVGDLLGMTQPEISKLEHRTDAYISTVRGYIEAMP